MTPHRAQAPSSVLIVEDDEKLRLILSTTLEFAGYTVRTAANGVLGLERFIEALPDLLITDHNMPAMTGANLVRNIKQLDPHFPVLIATGMAESHLLTDYLRYSKLLILPKPFTDDILFRAIDSLKDSDNKKSRRCSIRVPVSAEVHTRSHSKIQLINLGIGGLAARAEEPVPVGTPICIEIPTRQQSFQVKGITVWSRANEFGVRFEQLSGQCAKMLIQHLIETLRLRTPEMTQP